jgi:dsDNA-specific endonuclease/ATPase MutS2
LKLTERDHKILVVTEWHEFKKDREAFDEALRHIAALKGTNKTDIEACEERLNEMKYGDKKAPRKWARLDEERESLLKREEEIGRESMQRYNDLDAFLELCKNGSRFWKKAKPDKKRILADMIVSNAMIDGDKVASVTLTPQFEAWAKRGKNLDGRDGGTRTRGLLVPNQALYQLSYVPD